MPPLTPPKFVKKIEPKDKWLCKLSAPYRELRCSTKPLDNLGNQEQIAQEQCTVLHNTGAHLGF